MSAFHPLRTFAQFENVWLMWPNGETEWQQSTAGWLIAMLMLVVWGIWPAVVVTFLGVGGLMVRRVLTERR